MNAEQTERIITRVQVKEIIRRQATIGPDETMFDGVECKEWPGGPSFAEKDGVCPIEYGAGAAGILPVETITRRVLILEKWIDSELPPMPVPPKP